MRVGTIIGVGFLWVTGVTRGWNEVNGSLGSSSVGSRELSKFAGRLFFEEIVLCGVRWAVHGPRLEVSIKRVMKNYICIVVREDL